MAHKYEIGQKVTITPVKPQPSAVRDADIEQYAGQRGQIIDYYWITPGRGEVFYIYTVQVGDKQIVLHEDELTADIG